MDLLVNFIIILTIFPLYRKNSICSFSCFLSDFDFTTENNKLSSEKRSFEVNSYHWETIKSKTFNLMGFIFRNDSQNRNEFEGQQASQVGHFSQMMFQKHISLPLHQRIHTKEKSYECKGCRKGFRKYSHLTENLKDHSGVRPCECRECGKAFLVLQHFIRHKKSHTDLKPYECNCIWR